MTQLHSTLANIYHEMYQHVFGLDLFNEMLEIARLEVKTGKFIQCEILKRK